MSTTEPNQPGDGSRLDRVQDRYSATIGSLVRRWRAAWPPVVEGTGRVIEVVQRRWWSRLSHRRQYAFVVVCGVLLAVAIGLAVYEVAPGQRGVAVPTPVAFGLPSRIEVAKQPLVVPVRASSIQEITALSVRQRRSLAREVADKILTAIEADPRRVAVIHLLELPLSFAAVSYPDRRRLAMRLAGDPADRYETAIADLLDDVIDAIERDQPKAILTVLGLPVEPEEAGMNLLAVQRTNGRYDGILERLGPFVPARRFVLFGSSLDERVLAGLGMREALRLRHGRPIIFQTNLVWRALVDEEQQGGRDYQLEALLAD